MARYDVIVTMDDDLQHCPEDLPALISKLDEGYDVVYGVPRVRQQTWWKAILAALVKWVVSSLIGLSEIRDMSSFKVFRASLKPSFAEFNSPDVQIDVLLSWATTRFAGVQIEEATRTSGKSNYNIKKLVKVSLLILTNYTTIPLRLASILGFVFTIFGVFVLIYVIGVFFTVGSIPGFTFLASAITIFSGVQLFALGIIGEYLARMFERTSGKQPYVVIKTTGQGE
jgi:undecaprenyl-phosphate 4-deoxy-4-formamido-L-arabinose transferase